MEQDATYKNKTVFAAMTPKQSLRDAAGRGGVLSDKKAKRVFVAMSGGVDSSVAALLLKDAGYDVTGVFMNCVNRGNLIPLGAHCAAEADATDARRVAEKLKIPFYVWDFEEEYKKRVVDYMVEGYRQGITPNPDVMCNREIKFGLFFDRARAAGADYVATGHYVKLANSGWRMANSRHNKPSAIGYKLYAARDAQKDQSYFLWTLTQEKLRHCLFPIGDYLKSEVREIASKAGLPTAEKKDSQGICFLGQVSLSDFLRAYIPSKKGDVLSIAGKKIGEHDGAHLYTIGQRRGLAAGSWQLAVGEKDRKPVYVAEKDVRRNTLVVAEGNENPALYKKEIELAEINFLDQKYYFLIRANKKIAMMARVRYRQPLAEAVLRQSRVSNLKSKKYRLIFNEPQKFVAPGQSAVFYEKDPASSPGLKMLGGGVITAVN